MPCACLQCVEAGKQHRIAAAATEQAACEHVLWHAVPAAGAATPGSVGLKPPDLEHLHAHGQVQVRSFGGAQPGGSLPGYDGGDADREDVPRCPVRQAGTGAQVLHQRTAPLPVTSSLHQRAAAATRRLSRVLSLALHPQRQCGH